MIPAKKLLGLALSKEAYSVVFDYDPDDAFGTAKEAWRNLLQIEEAWVSFIDAHGATLGEALLMAPGPGTCAPDESIADYGLNPWMIALVKEAENDTTEV